MMVKAIGKREFFIASTERSSLKSYNKMKQPWMVKRITIIAIVAIGITTLFLGSVVSALIAVPSASAFVKA
jgi:hypothetical protein